MFPSLVLKIRSARFMGGGQHHRTRSCPGPGTSFDWSAFGSPANKRLNRRTPVPERSRPCSGTQVDCPRPAGRPERVRSVLQRPFPCGRADTYTGLLMAFSFGRIRADGPAGILATPRCLIAQPPCSSTGYAVSRCAKPVSVTTCAATATCTTAS